MKQATVVEQIGRQGSALFSLPKIIVKNKVSDRTIHQLLNSVIAKCPDMLAYSVQ